MKSQSVVILIFLFAGVWAAAKTEVNDKGEVGESAARKYFRKPAADETPVRDASSGGTDHYLAVHLGSYISSDSYQWGQNPHLNSVGRLNLGLTYRLGSMGSLADTAIRADFLGFSIQEGNPIQVAFLPMVLFPEASSKFPLFFGVGLGPGFFFNQISQESFLSANYQLVAGARFFNVLDRTGFFLEGGLKNGFLLLTDGQYIGYFLAIGAVFAF